MSKSGLGREASTTVKAKREGGRSEGGGRGGRGDRRRKEGKLHMAARGRTHAESKQMSPVICCALGSVTEQSPSQFTWQEEVATSPSPSSPAA